MTGKTKDRAAIDAARQASLSETASRYGVDLSVDGDEFVACCPFHSEDTPSFTIFTGRDHVQRFHCFGCDAKGDVLDFVQGIKGVDLKSAIAILGGREAGPNVAPKKIEKARDIYKGIVPLQPPAELSAGKRVKLYNPKRAGDDREWGSFSPSMVFPYHRPDGSLLGYVLRHDLPSGKKETPMVMFCRLPDGRETWSRYPFPKPRPLYGHEEIGDAKQVIVVEGEKARDKLRRTTGRAVVSWPGGTQGVKHCDWSPLARKNVVIWADADGPGIATANAIGAVLAGLGATVRVLAIKIGGEKNRPYRFADWKAGTLYEDGWDAADAVDDEWSKEELDDFMRATVRPWEPPKEEAGKMEDARRSTGSDPIPDPREFPAIQEPAKCGDPYWQNSLLFNPDGKLLPNVTKNWTLFLEHDTETAGMLALDEFSGETMLVQRPPWDVRRGQWEPRPINDGDLSEAVEWLEERRMTPKVSNIAPVIDKIAARHPFHPVRGYFSSLPKWDGTKRLDTFLTYYLGADDTPLNRAIGRKWLCAVVRRVFVPGCKFDHVLVLQGAQGMGKSEFGKALVPVPTWISESVNVGDRSREVIENTRGVLIVELAELAGKSTKEIEAIKKFITVTKDKARGAYMRKVQEVPRQFVFYATTNNDQFLTDTTGNRRWWPIVPARIDLKAIRYDRDQIWAEALTIYDTENLWLDTPNLEAELDLLNKDKVDYGPFYDVIADALPEEVSALPLAELRRLLSGGSDDVTKLPYGWQTNVRRAMVGLGFDPKTKVIRRGHKTARAFTKDAYDPEKCGRYSNGRIELDKKAMPHAEIF
jgi:predicted P-loop ATPase